MSNAGTWLPLLWLICAIVSYIIARNHGATNTTAIGWFILGLFVGPLAIPGAFAFVKPAFTAEERAEIAARVTAAKAQATSDSTTLPDYASSTTVEVTDTIRRLAELRDTGAITVEEYEAKKAELLGRL